MYFFQEGSHPIIIDLNGSTITSSNTMNVLGVIFDLKLQWSNHVANTIRKANSALHANKIQWCKYSLALELMLRPGYDSLENVKVLIPLPAKQVGR